MGFNRNTTMTTIRMHLFTCSVHKRYELRLTRIDLRGSSIQVLWQIYSHFILQKNVFSDIEGVKNIPVNYILICKIMRYKIDTNIHFI